MKKILMIISLALTCSISVGAWGRLGHATIAEIAERHLDSTAKANIEKYTQGVPLASFASWLDAVRKIEPYKKEFAGYHASICTEDCQSPIYIRKMYRDCKDGVSALEFYTACLKDYKEMPDSVVFKYIKAMVHAVGDFHCPGHVRYTDEENGLKYSVLFFDKKTSLHTVWDSGLINKGSGFKSSQYAKYADRLDTWNQDEIEKATAGWAREWFEDCARDVRPTIRTVPEDAVLGQEFIDKNIGLAELELRKAGYQLAKLLNTIFAE